MAYDYLKAMEGDIKRYLREASFDYKDCEGLDDLKDTLYDDFWDEDSVTGNLSGSYTFNSEEAKGYIGDNLDLMVDAYSEFEAMDNLLECMENSYFETIDVTIRCYLLGQAIDEVLEDTEFLKKVGLFGVYGFIGDEE